MNAGGAAHLSGCGADVGEDPRPGHGHVDVGVNGRGEVGGGGGDPREEGRVGAGDPGLVQPFAQGEGFGELGDTQPVGAAFQGGERDGEQAVPVGVGLDGRELERAGGGGPQDAQVVPDGGQVDNRLRRVSPSFTVFVRGSHSPSISREPERAARLRPSPPASQPVPSRLTG